MITHTERRAHNVLKYVGAILVAALAATGCGTGSTSETSIVTFAIEFDESLCGSSQKLSKGGPGPISRAFIYADVDRILVDVTEESGAPAYVNFDLTLTAGAWTGTLPFLPKNSQLTFIAHASDSGTELFAGSTTTALTTDNETVSIILASARDCQPVPLPRILMSNIPSEFASSQNGNISFYIQGNTGEQLSYTITAAAGSFFPASGSITLAATSGTFVSQYLPPMVSEETLFTHQVQVTNSTGHSVSRTFKTWVSPPGFQVIRCYDRSALFNPIINDIQASRVLGTADVIWQATVVYDGPEAELTYHWGFTPSGTVDPLPAFTGPTNPSTLQNYTVLVQGTVTLAVTDISGDTTTLSYPLTPGRFPD